MLPEGSSLLFLLGASLALIATPGQDNLYVLTRGVAQGRRAALVSSWGVCAGLLVHTTLAAAGLSAILASSAAAFQVVKYAGAAYLVYLGVKTLFDRESFSVPESGRLAAGLRSIFAQGLLTNVLNPKVALFFLAFLPQFAGSGGALGFLSLGAAFTLLTLVFTGVIALFSGALGGWFRGRPGPAKALGYVTGGVIVGLGLRLAFAESG
ncbi:LysE family translocator [Rubrobacter aplysinae]|uniref:LysE family translocator n=1 Tax=Rubrobacter aplysinae TaxID=909625 RepID=UPI00069EA5C6|nr:LysE family translocator [Rubrobacter aplysinae]